MLDPKTLKQQIPLSEKANTTVFQARQTIASILAGNDPRLVIIVGPCSIHDSEAALEYAARLKKLQEKHQDTLCLVMRAYVEKPRTTTGWKGLVYDPDLNQTDQIKKGLFIARDLLSQLNTLGIPIATEILNPFITPYLSDLISWGVIGARTVESQIHRELASHLPFTMGFKNSTQGNIYTAIEAVQTAMQPHCFIHITDESKISDMQSSGNPYCHVVLRGAQQFTNYDENTVSHTQQLLKQLNLPHRIMIDCSHGNSQKNPSQQMDVVHHLIDRIARKEDAIFGIMIESFLVSGKQTISAQNNLVYGQSITDPCIGWQDTEIVIEQISETMKTIKRTVE